MLQNTFRPVPKNGMRNFGEDITMNEEFDGYVVPVDPMDELDCDSCQ